MYSFSTLETVLNMLNGSLNTKIFFSFEIKLIKIRLSNLLLTCDVDQYISKFCLKGQDFEKLDNQRLEMASLLCL